MQSAKSTLIFITIATSDMQEYYTFILRTFKQYYKLGRGNKHASVHTVYI